MTDREAAREERILRSLNGHKGKVSTGGDDVGVGPQFAGQFFRLAVGAYIAEVVQRAWNWFIVPAHRLNPTSYAQALALTWFVIFIACLFTKEDSDPSEHIVATVATVSMAWIVLFVAHVLT